MQRLTSRLRLRLGRRRRLAGERGSTAVLISLLIVPLLGFAAIAVDIGSLYAEKARLQISADAAALAVAQDCARGACGDMLATASALVKANDPSANTANPVLGGNPLSVTVSGSVPKKHWFAPAIGYDSTKVSATSTVAWGGPSQGTAKLPLTFSWCEWYAQTGGAVPSGTTERTILFPKTSATGCTGNGNKFIPGGFGWLTTNGNTCKTTSAMGNKEESEPGNNPSQGCAPQDFSALQDQVVLLPIFDESGGTGSSGWYHVFGYAAFKITGYYFAGQYSWNKPCNGSDRCIKGYFTRFVSVGEAFEYGPGAPQLGAWVLRLIK